MLQEMTSMSIMLFHGSSIKESTAEAKISFAAKAFKPEFECDAFIRLIFNSLLELQIITS
jgi:hypothetical protein